MSTFDAHNLEHLNKILTYNSSSAEVLLYVNENRQKILEDTINLQPTISPPIQLEQIKIAYLFHNDQ
ncbi:MAG: hypothetical protein ACRCZ0_07655 [Cetobacterium sp.]